MVKLNYKICDPCKKGTHLWCTRQLSGGLECTCQDDMCREVRLDKREN